MPVTRTTRVLSVLAAAALACASGAPAMAQPSTSTAPGGGLGTPPPLPPDFATPVDDGKPDQVYTAKTRCVESRDATVPLEHKPWGQDLLRFDEVAKFATGKGQKVAVIDTGVTPHHYLGDRLEGGGDYVIQAENGLKDCDGHGTEVAGIIAANPNDDAIGFRGIAPDARILSIRQSSGNYEYKDPASNESAVAAGNLGTLAKAIVRAADTPGVTVINMSVDSCRPANTNPIALPELQVQAALRYAVEVKNVVAVASAGNVPEGKFCKEQNGPDPVNPTQIVIPPWFSEYVLSVAAMEQNGDVAPFSMTGPWVSVAAPGTDIISLDPANPAGLANQSLTTDGAQPIQGTSFAAPYVAGLAALVRQRFPELTAEQVMDRIKATASHPAATGGHDSLVGYGMINPIAALTAFIPAEKNIPADKPIDAPFTMPPPYEHNWTPMQVAMIGSGGGLGALLLTLFVVHTVRRNRKDPDEAKPRHRT
jgi:membrane-anchored mycosin MYCP